MATRTEARRVRASPARSARIAFALSANGYAELMSEPLQGSDRHNPRLDDDMGREPAAEDETADPRLWDSPGHDDVVTDTETDPDRTDLRSQIGKQVSLVGFPARAGTLVAAAEANDASDPVLEALEKLDPAARFADTSELWDALGLSPGRRP
jgi:hypothetical protein